MSCIFCKETHDKMFGGKVKVCNVHYEEMIEEQRMWYKGLLLSEDREMMIHAKNNGYVWKNDCNNEMVDYIDKEELIELIKEGRSDNFCIAYLSVTPKYYKKFCKDNNIINLNGQDYSYRGVSLEEILNEIKKGYANYEIIEKYEFNGNGFRAFLRNLNIDNPNKGKPGKKW